MAERVLFLTGRLAAGRLERLLAGLAPLPFEPEVRDLGVKVAALMTDALIRRRLAAPLAADRVILPGRFRGDLAALSAHYGAPFERGPDELGDLPEFLGRAGGPPDLSKHDVRIFAEIVEAPSLEVPGILARAEAYRAAGADVIDLGCLPDTPFPHLEDAVRALAAAGFKVSVDSADREELRRGGRAGADYLLSLTEESLDLLDEVEATPILIPAKHGDLDSLLRAMDALDEKGRAYIADPILDPIHFGFTESLLRYQALHARRPEAEILMGTGNLTELTDADSAGVTAALMGVVSELEIRNVLVVQVSPHCRRVVQEHDAARRLMYAARADGSLPNLYSNALLALHERKPIAAAPEEIAELAGQITDRNFRIEVAADGIHCYNADGHRVVQDPFELFALLGVEQDGSHAFYLGYELARAELAWRLGKRYAQDEPLHWGAALDSEAEDKTHLKAGGATLEAAKAEKRRKKTGGGRAQVIRETIVTTRDDDGGRVQIAPIGLIEEGAGWVIAPFRPSTTLDNLRAQPFAVANYCDDVRVFAGCLTGRRDWPTRPAERVPGAVLESALAHAELEVARVTEDELRPRFHCKLVHQASHRPFQGFNRAQAAVIEAAILVSRLERLPWDKIAREIAYLEIAVSKTAGPREREAWGWLMEKIDAHRAEHAVEAGS